MIRPLGVEGQRVGSSSGGPSAPRGRDKSGPYAASPLPGDILVILLIPIIGREGIDTRSAACIVPLYYLSPDSVAINLGRCILLGERGA